MPTLATELRNKLERVVIDARDAAEPGARAALEALAVHHYEPYPHMKRVQRELRNNLRARARQLGDRKLPKPDSKGKDHEIDRLAGECAYEHWHRMLFARFLAENGLLIEPQDNMAISLAEAEELAKEEGMDVWVYASRCAQQMLPQIFRPDDPLLQVPLASEHMLKLEKLVASLPQPVFTASDALGWVYQFWQGKENEKVNRSEVKIGAVEIAAVTQRFTEPYMVQFLIHNTLGAWWAGNRLSAEDATSVNTEDDLRRLLALPGVRWEYLRFVRGEDGKGGPWRPAVGTFDGWPKTAAQLKLLDPCCGSGHFLVAALHHLVPIRMAEEGLSTTQAVDAVLRNNLHGLEIDERCCQIAAFALALAAWTYPDAGGHRPLPDLHIACTGIGPQSPAGEWLKLVEQSGIPTPAEVRDAVKNGLLNLHQLFSQAPTLGSLIDPSALSRNLVAADYGEVQPYLAAILKAEKADDETCERAIAAAGMAKAANLLAGDYTLVITNVPYLGRSRQDDLLKAHLEKHYEDGKADLASAFVLRCLGLCAASGTAAMVTPQSWLFLNSYSRLRKTLLTHRKWNVVARLGPGAFEEISGHVVNVALSIISAENVGDSNLMAGLNVSFAKKPSEKASLLRDAPSAPVVLIPQAEQLKNPDAAITFTLNQIRTYLYDYAGCYQGLTSGDDGKWRRHFWEPAVLGVDWLRLQTPSQGRGLFAGRGDLISSSFMESDEHTGAIRGRHAWGKVGVAIDRVGSLARAMYEGDLFHSLIPVVVAHKNENRPAVAAFCLSDDFISAAREFNQSLSIDNGYLSKIPFDLDHWKELAVDEYPDGLPEPESDDPTQWLFHGRPDESTAPLQVAMGRLLGYRWPGELDEKMRLSKRAHALVARCGELTEFTNDTGVVCIPSVRGEEPAAERLLALLVAADIEPQRMRELGGGTDIDDWLRSSFFEEHCELFDDRPFVWHIWDGRKRDGFHALVNYHKLCEGNGKGRKLLESLTYAYLGEWITRQKDGVKRGDGGAEDRLAAALELQNRLKLIIEGEPPFDIFVRWKPLAEQPIGWEPDINDGVRVNIRPFLSSDLRIGRAGAGVLRWKPNIKWTKDRGKEPERSKAEYPWFWNWDETTEDFMGTGKEPDGNRHNDCHYTIKTKQSSRDAVKKGNR